MTLRLQLDPEQRPASGVSQFPAGFFCANGEPMMKCDECGKSQATLTRLAVTWQQLGYMNREGHPTFCGPPCARKWARDEMIPDDSQTFQPPNESTEAPAAGSEHAEG